MSEYEYFAYDNVPSYDFGFYISDGNISDAPARDVTSVEVPGRNGELTIDNGRFKNVTVKYKAYTLDGQDGNLRGMRNFLLSRAPKYCKLQDTLHPDEYRMGRFLSAFGPDIVGRQAAEVELSFNCRPERYLVSGDTEHTYTASGTIMNSTSFEAMPIIKVIGAGSLTVGNGIYTIAAHDGTMQIDCDKQNAYEALSGADQNSLLTVTKWGGLVPGINTITIGSGITSVVIIPKWWIL